MGPFIFPHKSLKFLISMFICSCHFQVNAHFFWEKSGALHDRVVNSSVDVHLEKVTTWNVFVSTLHLISSYSFFRSQLSVLPFKSIIWSFAFILIFCVFPSWNISSWVFCEICSFLYVWTQWMPWYILESQ